MSKWLAPLIVLLSVTGLKAQQSTVTPPKLVVSIVVNELKGDYLDYFSSLFGERGFKRLMNEGLYYYSVEFGFPNLSEASSAASIYTGTYPYYHGITGNKKYDFSLNREVSIVADNNFMGNYTTDRFSPLSLQASTIGDELKIASNGKSKVYSIAPNAAQAIVSAGRYADGAFWLDDYNGKWATTTYYKDLPYFVDRYNSTSSIGNYSDKTWTQSHSHYIGFPYSTRTTSFSYSFPKSDNNRFLKIKQSSLINSEVTDLAIQFMESNGLGRNVTPDLLALTYYAGNYKFGENCEEYSFEIQDIYYRLDKELEKLFDTIDKKVGMGNALILLTSSGYYDSLNLLPEGYQPAGEFHPNRCTALLNMYLMAVYGQGNWVNAFYQNQIYLNKKLAEEKQVKWEELLRKAAEFVSQFTGVQDVTTSGQQINNDSERSAYFRRGMYSKLSGDIFVELQPGWIIVDEKGNDKKEYRRDNMIPAPLFIYGRNIKKENIDRRINVAEIASSLSFILRIRPPNACKEFALREITNK